MKVLIAGGSYDEQGGRPSRFVEAFAGVLGETEPDWEIMLRNGGSRGDLTSIWGSLESLSPDIVFWWPNVPNGWEKQRDVKSKLPHAVLATSKRNDGGIYPFKELVNRALAVKANLAVEFRKQGTGTIWMRVFDPLGNVWYQGESLYDAAEVLSSRLRMLKTVTRKPTIQSMITREAALGKFTMNADFVSVVRKYGNTFHQLMGVADGVSRFLGNASMRGRVKSTLRHPPFKDGMVFMSERNVDKRAFTESQFVPVYQREEKIYFIGDRKPSVDTPVQMELYRNLPWVNYMLHSHCYLEGAPVTETPVPCGALEEVGEILKVVKNLYPATALSYRINLAGHGSLVMGNCVKDFENLPYVARPLPENQEGR